MSVNCDVAVIGAGPYGLSTGAHLRARGLTIRIFGEPMSFWDRFMPEGVVLRSPWDASQISDPQGKLTLDAYQAAHGLQIQAPIPINHFVSYGRWFQEKALPDVDRRKIARVEAIPDGFELTLDDGEKFQSRRVVVAGGISQFASRPQQLEALPREFASHSTELRRPAQYAGKQVLVVGGGQSALESAALLHEAGADVEVVVRDAVVHWTWQRPWLHTFKPVGAILYAWPDVGPAFVSHVIARPGLYRRMSRSVQNKWAARSLRGTGAGWLKPRLQEVQISTSRAISSATIQSDRVNVSLNDGSHRTVDHIVMGTGFKIDLDKYGLFSAKVLSAIHRVGGYPVLNAQFETSCPGLYIVGAPAAYSFGPLMRFVAGADFAARAVTRGVVKARNAQPVRKTVPAVPDSQEVHSDV